MQLLHLRVPASDQTRTRSNANGTKSRNISESTDERTVDFTGFFIRRSLQSRIRGGGRIDVNRSRQWGITIVHHYTSKWSGQPVVLPVAQLRVRGDQSLQLYWKRASGRWAPYPQQSEQPFIASLAECLDEIRQDRWGCFWG